MTVWETVLVGSVAGFAIFLGLPFARVRRVGVPMRTFLGGVSAGILVFLLAEILTHAAEPIERAANRDN